MASQTTAKKNFSQQTLNTEEQLERIHSIIQKSLELGIAGICYHRNIFPSSFFDHGSFTSRYATKSNGFAIPYFSRETIFSQSTQNSSDHDEEETKITSRFLSEARYLLHWLQNGISVMKEGLLSRVIFGVCLPNPDVNLQDILMESYAFDISHYNEKHKSVELNNGSKKSELNPVQIQKSIEGIFRNLQGYSETLPTNKLVESEACSISLSLLSSSMAASAYKNDSLFSSSRYLTLRLDFNQEIPLSISCNMDKIANPDIHATIGKQMSNLSKSKTCLGQVGQRDKMGFTLNMSAYYREEDDDENDKDVDFKLQKHQKLIQRLPQMKIKRVKQASCTIRKNFDSKSPLSSNISIEEEKRSSIIDPLPNKTKAYAIPYGICRKKSNEPCHIPCVIVDNSITGNDKIQYKVIFNCSKLIKARKAKQWISSKKLISKKDLIRIVQKYSGGRGTDVESIASELQIDTKLVRSIIGNNDGRDASKKNLKKKSVKEIKKNNSPNQQQNSAMDKINAIINSDLRTAISFSSHCSRSSSSDDDDEYHKISPQPQSKNKTHEKIRSIINDDLPLTYDNKEEHQYSKKYIQVESCILEKDENDDDGGDYTLASQSIKDDGIIIQTKNTDVKDLRLANNLGNDALISSANNILKENEKDSEISNDKGINICYSNLSNSMKGSYSSKMQCSDQGQNNDVSKSRSEHNSTSSDHDNNESNEDLLSKEQDEISSLVQEGEHCVVLDEDDRGNNLIVQEEEEEPTVHVKKKIRYSYIVHPIVIDF